MGSVLGVVFIAVEISGAAVYDSYLVIEKMCIRNEVKRIIEIILKIVKVNSFIKRCIQNLNCCKRMKRSLSAVSLKNKKENKSQERFLWYIK